MLSQGACRELQWIHGVSVVSSNLLRCYLQLVLSYELCVDLPRPCVRWVCGRILGCSNLVCGGFEPNVVGCRLKEKVERGMHFLVAVFLDSAIIPVLQHCNCVLRVSRKLAPVLSPSSAGAFFALAGSSLQYRQAVCESKKSAALTLRFHVTGCGVLSVDVQQHTQRNKHGYDDSRIFQRNAFAAVKILKHLSPPM